MATRLSGTTEPLNPELASWSCMRSQECHSFLGTLATNHPPICLHFPSLSLRMSQLIVPTIVTEELPGNAGHLSNISKPQSASLCLTENKGTWMVFNRHVISSAMACYSAAFITVRRYNRPHQYTGYRQRLTGFPRRYTL